MAPSLCQIALSVEDLERSHEWYAEGLGLLPAGGQRISGPALAPLMDLPEVEAEIQWLVDGQDRFQLELFRFERPLGRPRPDGWRPSDVGYSAFAVHVPDYEDALARVAALGSPPLSEPIGPAGARRACVADPAGVLVELMEDDPRGPVARERVRPGVPVVRGVRLSVADLHRARRFWEATLGLAPATGDAPHGPEHEALWGLSDARRDVVALWACDVAVELACYADPAPRDRPADHRLCDLGILNVALGGPDEQAYAAAVASTREGGYHHNAEIVRPPHVAATYLVDDQGFSLELLYSSREAARRGGFEPLPR
jgi:catechol 2,3-dioxygenase-like lactoylglutathione lyase family enzyme